MEKLITMQNLHDFAYCNDRICKQPIKGLVLSFFGLGDARMLTEDPDEGHRFAERGILYLVPYQNPWAWMNRQNVAFTDELVDVLWQAYQLPDTLPIVSSGGSMGGLSALVYMVYAKRTPVACAANCPVCDLPYHFSERRDLPRTLYSAFGTYEGTMEEALRSASPLHLIERMPTQAEYFIFHCGGDLAVNAELHSGRFVEQLQKTHRVSYDVVPERGHCDLSPELWAKYDACICKAILG